jgi:hypothetical protein
VIEDIQGHVRVKNACACTRNKAPFDGDLNSSKCHHFVSIIWSPTKTAHKNDAAKENRTGVRIKSYFSLAFQKLQPQNI